MLTFPKVPSTSNLRSSRQEDSPAYARDRFYAIFERFLLTVRGRPTQIDRRVPVRSFMSNSASRCMYAFRGLLRTALFKGRPTLVFLGPRVKLANIYNCHFGQQVTIETGSMIDGLSYRGIRLGNHVIIGSHCIIRSSSMQGIGQGMIMGDNSSCDAWCFFGAGGLIRIGNNVIMGQHTSFHAETHNHDLLDIPMRSQGIVHLPITVEDDCWIGANVTFLGGIHIGHGSIVGAGALVRTSFPPYSIIAGVPAKLIRLRGPGHTPEDSEVASAEKSPDSND